jgi:hypothetical protein
MHNSYILSNYSSQFALEHSAGFLRAAVSKHQSNHSQGLDFPASIKSSSKMPPKTRRLTSLAASKVIRKRALKTTVKKGQIWQRSRRQVQLRMRATEPNRLLGAREMLALVEYIHHP